MTVVLTKRALKGVIQATSHPVTHWFLFRTCEADSKAAGIHVLPFNNCENLMTHQRFSV